MHTAIKDLGLERLQVVYPGRIYGRLDEKIELVPLLEVAARLGLRHGPK